MKVEVFLEYRKSMKIFMASGPILVSVPQEGDLVRCNHFVEKVQDNTSNPHPVFVHWIRKLIAKEVIFESTNKTSLARKV